MPQNLRPPDDEPVDLETKPFLAHLEDLRWTIIRCILVLALGVTASAFGAKYILAVLYRPYIQAGQDPKKLFNASLEGNTRRAIDLREGEKINEAAFKQLIRAAVAANSAALAQRAAKKK